MFASVSRLRVTVGGLTRLFSSSGTMPFNIIVLETRVYRRIEMIWNHCFLRSQTTFSSIHSDSS